MNALADASSTLDAAALRDIALAAGADDAGFVSIDNPALDDQRAEIRAVFPFARTLISFVVRMNRENLRSPARSLANHEFHHANADCDAAAHAMSRALEARGLRAGYAPAGFPVEADRWPDKLWVISHKPVAVAAGLGHMGVHRNVIHPKFGSFILLGTVAIDAEVAHECAPLAGNPCLACKLCVAACPTGAIDADGHFDFSACYTHNYREFMGGFVDFVETVAEAKNAQDLRGKITDAETVSMWQSLSYKPNYKAAYCLAVCPAGEDVIGPYRDSKKGFLRAVVDPLQEKVETIYVRKGSDAEDHVGKRFPHKKAKPVDAGLRPSGVDGFLAALPHMFQRNKSTGLDAVYHFTFTGARRRQATIVIADRKIDVRDGHIGAAGLAVVADSETWMRFLRKEASLPWALISRRIRLKGDPRLLVAFGRCFPG